MFDLWLVFPDRVVQKACLLSNARGRGTTRGVLVCSHAAVDKKKDI